MGGGKSKLKPPQRDNGEEKVNGKQDEDENGSTDVEESIDGAMPSYKQLTLTKEEDNKEIEHRPEPKTLVVAIDLGTTYSGFAFSFGHAYTDIHTNVWHSSKLVRQKVPTCVLLTPQKEMHSFGFSALSQYGNLESNEERQRWCLFRQFKMNLHQTKEVSGSFKLRAQNGQEVDASEIFGWTIRSIKDECMSIVKNSDAKLTERDITWVITVPAIWKESSKKFMRKAAEMAGLESSNVEIALEPEAAALYCHNVHKRDKGRTERLFNEFPVGLQYMVLDCGGGTVDVAVHEVLPGNKLKELHVVSGGDWGGSNVNKAFLSFLSNLLGPTVFHRFVEGCTDDYFTLIEDFELKKRSITPESTSLERIRLPSTLKDLFTEEVKTKMSDKYGDRVSLITDKLTIDAEIFRGFFCPTIEYITKHVRHLLKCLPKTISVVLMVGGFSDSKLVQSSIRAVVGEDRKLIIPIDAGNCVVQGAVLFGHYPLRVAIRKIPFTYGLSTTIPYKIAHGDLLQPHRKVKVRGVDMLDDVFDKHVTIGQEVRTDEGTEWKTYYPMTTTDQSIPLYLYRSTNPNPIFVDDEDCERVGTYVVDMPRDLKFTSVYNCKVQAQLFFGGTDITVVTKTMNGQVTSSDFTLK